MCFLLRVGSEINNVCRIKGAVGRWRLVLKSFNIISPISLLELCVTVCFLCERGGVAEREGSCYYHNYHFSLLPAARGARGARGARREQKFASEHLEIIY